MSLVVRQGNFGLQNPQSKKFYNEYHVMAEIVKLEMSPFSNSIINVHLKFLTGNNIGTTIIDAISPESNHPLTFKYINLRESAYCPCNQDEGNVIDLEELLLNKHVEINLSEGIKRDGSKYQKVNYVVPYYQQHTEIAEYNATIIPQSCSSDGFLIESDIYNNPFSDEAIAEYDKLVELTKNKEDMAS